MSVASWPLPALALAERPCPECGEPVVDTANGIRLDPPEEDGLFDVILVPGAIIAAANVGRPNPYPMHEHQPPDGP